MGPIENTGPLVIYFSFIINSFWRHHQIIYIVIENRFNPHSFLNKKDLQLSWICDYTEDIYA